MKWNAKKIESQFKSTWELFPKKTDKTYAHNRFLKLVKEGYPATKIKKAVKEYIRNTPNPKSSTYILNSGIFDYMEKKIPTETVKPNKPKRKSSSTYERNIKMLNKMPYPKYLKTEHWQHFRKEALKFAEYTCNKCKIKNTTLHVHHLTYENRGRETFNDIMVLCEKCHKLEHKK